MIKRPCLNCGTLTANVTRCTACQSLHNQLYDHDYKQRAAIIRQTATNCWLCGHPERPDDPFTADHVIPNNKQSELRAAHRSCNSSRKDLPAHVHRTRKQK